MVGAHEKSSDRLSNLSGINIYGAKKTYILLIVTLLALSTNLL